MEKRFLMQFSRVLDLRRGGAEAPPRISARAKFLRPRARVKAARARFKTWFLSVQPLCQFLYMATHLFNFFVWQPFLAPDVPAAWASCELTANYPLERALGAALALAILPGHHPLSYDFCCRTCLFDKQKNKYSEIALWQRMIDR